MGRTITSSTYSHNISDLQGWPGLGGDVPCSAWRRTEGGYAPALFLFHLRGFLILLSQSWVSRVHPVPAISSSQLLHLLYYIKLHKSHLPLWPSLDPGFFRQYTSPVWTADPGAECVAFRGQGHGGWGMGNSELHPSPRCARLCLGWWPLLFWLPWH